MNIVTSVVLMSTVITTYHGGSNAGDGGGGDVFFSLSEIVFVVVHPNFENPSSDSNLIAKICNQLIVTSLHLPP